MKFTIANNTITQSVLLYTVFAFMIVSIFIIIDGILSVFTVSENIKHIVFYASSAIPILLIVNIIKTENDSEEK